MEVGSPSVIENSFHQIAGESMSRLLPFLLWIAAIVFALVLYWNSQRQPAGAMHADAGNESTAGMVVSEGVVIKNVPWKHLQTIPPFEFQTQAGERLKSSDLAGQAYVVNFFFASCPTICREFNAKVAEINEQLEKENVRFLSISVDPENDTVDVLKRYAEDYDAEPKRWAFLTGNSYMVKQVGRQGFNVVVESNTSHSDDFLLVDKWGRFRDRFQWDDPVDVRRLLEVVKDVSVEQAPPLGEDIATRNVMAGVEPQTFREVPWIREFWLTERSGETFYSKDLTGEVWIGNFFFTSCPGICKRQTQYLRGLQDRLEGKRCKIVSISTDPNHDSPEVLTEYANRLGADPKKWLFCRGNELLTKRIGSEFFTAISSGGHHSSLLYVVDRWGNVRGEFDWERPADEVALLQMWDELNAETVPVKTFKRRKVD